MTRQLTDETGILISTRIRDAVWDTDFHTVVELVVDQLGHPEVWTCDGAHLTETFNLSGDDLACMATALDVPVFTTDTTTTVTERLRTKVQSRIATQVRALTAGLGVEDVLIGFDMQHARLGAVIGMQSQCTAELRRRRNTS